jgi:hypothetical protein
MRGTWLVLVVIVWLARVAQAGHSIVVMSDPERVGALGSAMQLALAGRGVAIATVAAPTGELRLERAASAQRAALQLGADAALWIDVDGSALDVCAVSSDGRAFRHAPLPPDLADATPRAFSAIATSLLDELIVPPEPTPSVDVDVHVHVDGNRQATVDRAPPGFVDPHAAAPPAEVSDSADETEVLESAIPRTDRILVELGPMLSPATFGVMAEVAFPFSSSVRFGVMGGMHIALSDPVLVYNGAIELRAVIAGQRNHFDVGGIAGAASADDHSSSSTIGYLGASLNYTWEHATTGTTLSFVPLIATDGTEKFPGAYASLRWDLAL